MVKVLLNKNRRRLKIQMLSRSQKQLSLCTFNVEENRLSNKIPKLLKLIYASRQVMNGTQ